MVEICSKQGIFELGDVAIESYIKISNLNDFIFCPLSIYFHNLYGSLNTELYHTTKQKDGIDIHESVDNKNYSTHKNILQSIDVFSSEYKICGKIDTFDIDKGILTERKKHISTIYDGYVFQLYAQYYCLKEMGYNVRKIRLYSYDDNKIYPIELSSENNMMRVKFDKLLDTMHSFDLNGYIPVTKEKCENCIYSPLCDRSLAEV